MRAGYDTKPYLDATAKIHGTYQLKILAFLPPEVCGQAFSAAIIVLGRKAPASWRDASRRLLFASERPHFS